MGIVNHIIFKINYENSYHPKLLPYGDLKSKGNRRFYKTYLNDNSTLKKTNIFELKDSLFILIEITAVICNYLLKMTKF